MDEMIAQAERVARYDVPIDPRKVLNECAAALRASAERGRALRKALREYVNLVAEMEGVTFVDQMKNAELRIVIESNLADNY